MSDLRPDKLRRICANVYLGKYKKEIAAARVGILQRTLEDPGTADQYKILCVGERVENFEHEDATLHKTELLMLTSD